MNKPIISIIMGSDSDLTIMKQAAEIIEHFEIPYEMTIVSAHRTPERMFEYAKQAHKKGLRVIIAGAGGAAHLPGMVAAICAIPVIGVPIKSSNSIDGWDSLLSILQMPEGVPVATVAVDGAKNAGILAIQILAAADNELYKKLLKYKETLADEVEKKFIKLHKIGYINYLKSKQVL